MGKSKIGIAVDDELHARVKSIAPLRGLNLEGAYDQALRAWIGMPQEQPSPSARRFGRNQRWHDILEFVLANGSRKQAEWITGNLQTFAEAIRLKQGAEVAPEQAPAARRKSG
jgi:hypothetical protein